MKIDPIDLDMIFETSWEVCNKIGGIYTVLSTKALTLQNLYKDKTIFIGPDVWDEQNPCPYFSEVPSLLMPWKKKAETLVDVGGNHIGVLALQHFIGKLPPDLMGLLRRGFPRFKGLRSEEHTSEL